MILAIRHFPDRKRPCIVLEENNQALVLGYLTDRKREKWLRMALMREDEFQLAAQMNSPYTLDRIMESEAENEESYEERDECHNRCKDCVHGDEPWYSMSCDPCCSGNNNFEPKEDKNADSN